MEDKLTEREKDLMVAAIIAYSAQLQVDEGNDFDASIQRLAAVEGIFMLSNIPEEMWFVGMRGAREVREFIEQQQQQARNN